MVSRHGRGAHTMRKGGIQPMPAGRAPVRQQSGLPYSRAQIP